MVYPRAAQLVVGLALGLVSSCGGTTQSALEFAAAGPQASYEEGCFYDVCLNVEVEDDRRVTVAIENSSDDPRYLAGDIGHIEVLWTGKSPKQPAKPWGLVAQYPPVPCSALLGPGIGYTIIPPEGALRWVWSAKYRYCDACADCPGTGPLREGPAPPAVYRLGVRVCEGDCRAISDESVAPLRPGGCCARDQSVQLYSKPIVLP